MQAVILVAGKGTRMGELVNTIPKPLLFAKGKTLLEYKFDALPESVDEIVLVIGYLGEQIIKKFGTKYKKKKIIYVKQKRANGTGGALMRAKNVLQDNFLVMMGDDIYSKKDILNCLKFPCAVVTKKVSNTQKGGELFFDEKNKLIGTYEAKHYIKSGYINTGLYKLKKNFLNYKMGTVEGTKEFGIPQTLVSYAQKENVKVIISKSPWIQITNQTDLQNFTKRKLA